MKMSSNPPAWQSSWDTGSGRRRINGWGVKAQLDVESESGLWWGTQGVQGRINCQPAAPLQTLQTGIFFFLIYLAVLGLSWGMQDIVPWPGIEPVPFALGGLSLSP